MSLPTECGAPADVIEYVKSADGLIVITGGWTLFSNEIAEIVEVDRDGDFKLCNPRGQVSGLQNAKKYVHASPEATTVNSEQKGSSVSVPCAASSQHESGPRSVPAPTVENPRGKVGVPVLVHRQTSLSGSLGVMPAKAESLRAPAGHSKAESCYPPIGYPNAESLNAPVGGTQSVTVPAQKEALRAIVVSEYTMPRKAESFRTPVSNAPRCVTPVRQMRGPSRSTTPIAGSGSMVAPIGIIGDGSYTATPMMPPGLSSTGMPQAMPQGAPSAPSHQAVSQGVSSTGLQYLALPHTGYMTVSDSSTIAGSASHSSLKMQSSPFARNQSPTQTRSTIAGSASHSSLKMPISQFARNQSPTQTRSVTAPPQPALQSEHGPLAHEKGAKLLRGMLGTNSKEDFHAKIADPDKEDSQLNAHQRFKQQDSSIKDLQLIHQHREQVIADHDQAMRHIIHEMKAVASDVKALQGNVKSMEKQFEGVDLYKLAIPSVHPQMYGVANMEFSRPNGNDSKPVNVGLVHRGLSNSNGVDKLRSSPDAMNKQFSTSSSIGAHPPNSGHIDGLAKRARSNLNLKKVTIADDVPTLHRNGSFESFSFRGVDAVASQSLDQVEEMEGKMQASNWNYEDFGF
jgi:hypothetical protein